MNHFLKLTAFAMILLPALQTAGAEGYKNVEVEKVLTSTTTYSGQQLTTLRTRTPEVTALVVHVPPGGETGWHKHPVPVYAYMLEGELTVAMKDGFRRTFRKGEAILEVVDTLHNGYNASSQPASLVVFYVGAQGVPNVVRESEQAKQTAERP